jgi:hypothetical protein
MIARLMLSSRRRNDPGSWLEIFDSADNEVHRDFVEASSTPEDVCVEAGIGSNGPARCRPFAAQSRGAMSMRYSQDAILE